MTKLSYTFLLVLLINVVPSHRRTYESKSIIMYRTTEPYESMSNVSVTKGETVAYDYLYLVVYWPMSFCNINPLAPMFNFLVTLVVLFSYF